MSRITTIIFDMFNTLVEDGETFWNASFERIVTELDLDITGARLREVWSTGDQFFRESRTQDNAPFRSYCEAWSSSFQNAFAVLGLDASPGDALDIVVQDMAVRPVQPDTQEALSQLQGTVRLAVLSNADDRFLVPIAQGLGFPFEAVLSSEAARSYKPQPKLFRDIVEILKITPQEAVYVGDRQYEDVQGANSAGMPAAWINREGMPLNPGLPTPDHSLTTLLELPGIVARSN